MGKLSDVIKHAGELSEETDDEDLWEDEEPETGETESETEEAENVRTGESEAENGEESDSTDSDRWSAGIRGRENAERSGGGLGAESEISEGDDTWTEEAELSGRDNSRAENEMSEEDDIRTGEIELSGGDGTRAEEAEMSGEDDSQAEEDTEPECNEEGIPLKDIVYAESIRKRGKDQVVVQSVYEKKTIQDMLFRHAYLSTGGYCGLLISLCAIGAAIYTYGKIQVWISFVLLLAGCIFVVIEPFLLRDRAKQMTRKGGIYHMPILFVLTPYGIELTRNGNHASHDWGDITRVTTTKHAVVLYKGRHTALVLTKRGIGDQKERLYAMIRQCARNAKYMKLK